MSLKLEGMKGKDGEVEMSDHDKELLEKRKKFAHLILDGMSIAQAARTVKLSPAYTSRIKRGLDESEGKGGIPKTEEDAEFAESAVKAYFDSCEPEYWLDKDGEPLLDVKKRPIIKRWNRPTIAGLAMAVGYVTRESFMQATLADSPYARVLMRARFKIEQEHEENLYNAHSGGSEFALKNIAGWTDRQEIKQEVNASVQTKLEKLDDAFEDRIKEIARKALAEDDTGCDDGDGQ